jgi:hypothetical protein
VRIEVGREGLEAMVAVGGRCYCWVGQLKVRYSCFGMEVDLLVCRLVVWRV